MKSNVYFSRTITPEKVLELYRMTGRTLGGKVAVKIHSGEVGNQNFLKPDFWKPVIDHVGVVDCIVHIDPLQVDLRHSDKKPAELICVLNLLDADDLYERMDHFLGPDRQIRLVHCPHIQDLITVKAYPCLGNILDIHPDLFLSACIDPLHQKP